MAKQKKTILKLWGVSSYGDNQIVPEYLLEKSTDGKLCFKTNEYYSLLSELIGNKKEFEEYEDWIERNFIRTLENLKKERHYVESLFAKYLPLGGFSRFLLECLFDFTRVNQTSDLWNEEAVYPVSKLVSDLQKEDPNKMSGWTKGKPNNIPQDFPDFLRVLIEFSSLSQKTKRVLKHYKTKITLQQRFLEVYWSLNDWLAEVYIRIGKFDKLNEILEILRDANQKAMKWHCIYPDNRIDRWQSVTLKIIEKAKKSIIENEEIINIKQSWETAFGGWIGNSDSLLELMKVVKAHATRLKKVSKKPKVTSLYSNRHLLVLGESGTGKELVCHAIGTLIGKKVYSVNCASIPENLAYSELFGHTKGAFTGADRDRKGLFETAKDNVIFLDEFHHLDKNIQAMLLRVVEDNKFNKLGSDPNNCEPTQVTIIAASNLSVNKLQKRVLPDLLWRLGLRNEIYVPPLREREYDRMILAKKLMDEYSIQIEPTALSMFSSIPFSKGNIREMRNRVSRLATYLIYETDESDTQRIITFKDILKIFPNVLEENKKRIYEITKEMEVCDEKLKDLSTKERKRQSKDENRIILERKMFLMCELEKYSLLDYSENQFPSAMDTYIAYLLLSNSSITNSPTRKRGRKTDEEMKKRRKRLLKKHNGDFHQAVKDEESITGKKITPKSFYDYAKEHNLTPLKYPS